MHIEFLREDEAGRTTIRAHHGSDDLPLRVNTITYDVVPALVDDDRACVAGALAFLDNANHELSFDRPVTKNVADTIYQSTGRKVISEITPQVSLEEQGGNARTPSAIQATSLNVSFGSSFPDNTPNVDESRLSFVQSQRYEGALIGIKEMIVASNAWYVASFGNPKTIMLASALLFANDLYVKEVRLDQSDATFELPDWAYRLSESVGVAVN